MGRTCFGIPICMVASLSSPSREPAWEGWRGRCCDGESANPHHPPLSRSRLSRKMFVFWRWSWASLKSESNFSSFFPLIRRSALFPVCPLFRLFFFSFFFFFRESTKSGSSYRTQSFRAVARWARVRGGGRGCHFLAKGMIWDVGLLVPPGTEVAGSENWLLVCWSVDCRFGTPDLWCHFCPQDPRQAFIEIFLGKAIRKCHGAKRSQLDGEIPFPP